METATIQFSRLQSGRAYSMTVMNVVNARRNFKKAGTNTILYVHDIYTEDKEGKSYKSEYLTESVMQNEFQVGHNCYFKCVEVGRIADIIVPFDAKSDPSLANFVSNNPDIPDKEKLLQANRNVSISGTTYSLAMVCAKDFMIEVLKSNPELSVISEEFREQLFDVAEDINSWLVGKRDL